MYCLNADIFSYSGMLDVNINVCSVMFERFNACLYCLSSEVSLLTSYPEVYAIVSYFQQLIFDPNNHAAHEHLEHCFEKINLQFHHTIYNSFII